MKFIMFKKPKIYLRSLNLSQRVAICYLILIAIFLIQFIGGMLTQAEFGETLKERLFTVMKILFALMLASVLFAPIIAGGWSSLKVLRSPCSDAVQKTNGTWAVVFAVLIAVFFLGGKISATETFGLVLIPTAVWLYYSISKKIMARDGYPTDSFREFIRKNAISFFSAALWFFLIRIAHSYLPDDGFLRFGLFELIMMCALLIPATFYKIITRLVTLRPENF